MTVASFDVLALRRPTPDLLDVDVAVELLDGHLRPGARPRPRRGARRRWSPDRAAAHPRRGVRPRRRPARSTELEDDFRYVPLAEAVAAQFPRRDVDAEAAAAVAHGRPLPLAGTAPAAAPAGGPVGVFGPDGALLALMAPRDGVLRALVVFAPAQP